MKKFISISIALVLALSLCLVTAAPVTAEESGTLLSAKGVWEVEGQANEDMIVVVGVPDGTTLGDIDSISWAVYSLCGYPPHLDITLDCNENGVVDPEDMLTAEMAYNCVGAPWDIAPLCGQITYPTGWLQTFELTPGDGFGAVTDSTMLWVTKMGAGDDDAPWDTLANWKLGQMNNNPGDDSLTAGVINGSCPIVKLEIEVDNWVLDSEALVDNIKVIIAGKAIDLEATILSVPDIVAISVDTTIVDFGDLLPGATSAPFVITVSNVGSVVVDIKTSVTGDFFIANLYLDAELATAYTDSIAVEGSIVPSATVIVPPAQSAGKITGSLTFEATEQ